MKHAVNYLVGFFGLVLFVLCGSPVAHAQQNWYVRPDGGTRYSTNMLQGQCDGLANAPYPGAGVNRHCAFGEVEWLWEDGSYNANQPFPAWGWLAGKGDVVNVAAGTYRTGWHNAVAALDTVTGLQFGHTGDPYTGMPPMPDGVKILGAVDAAGKPATKILGSWGVDSATDTSGTNGVTLQNLEVTMVASCGVAGQANTCSSTQDYGKNGIRSSSNTVAPANNLTLVNVHVHGMANTGWIGATQGASTATNISLVGNGSSGYNADDGSGNHPQSGSLVLNDFDISWNGCVEQKGSTAVYPYADCTDDNSSGYGDGFGTATIPNGPAFHVTFENGVVSYNTQDGLDALHLSGPGSSTTMTNVLAYGNMGNQLKAGGNVVTVTHSLIYDNCPAMRLPFAGTIAGYNAKLSDFCRADDQSIAVGIGQGGNTNISQDTIVSASSIQAFVSCETSCPNDHSDTVTFANDLFIAYPNSPANGYPQGTGVLPTDIYVDDPIKYDPITSNIGNVETGTKDCVAANNCVNLGVGSGAWMLSGYDSTLPVGVPAGAVSTGGSTTSTPPPVTTTPPPVTTTPPAPITVAQMNQAITDAINAEDGTIQAKVNAAVSAALQTAAGAVK
jgi:hypothetical protein